MRSRKRCPGRDKGKEEAAGHFGVVVWAEDAALEMGTHAPEPIASYERFTRIMDRSMPAAVGH